MDVGTVLRRLDHEGELWIESTPALAADVHAKARELAKDHPAYDYRKKPVHVSTAPRTLRASPARVLHELGVATTLFTPSPFVHAAWHWARLRYCASLATRRGWLALTRHADEDIVYHHKVAQSEQLGIGFALLTVKRLLRDAYPGYVFTAVDAEVALKAGFIDGLGAVRQRKNVKKRPDYFLVGHPLSGRGAWKTIVLECKGTISQTHSIEQLATACVQVETIKIGDNTPPGMMVAAVLAPAAITVRVLDPAGVEDLWTGPDEQLDELLAKDPGDQDLRPHHITAADLEARRAALNDDPQPPPTPLGETATSADDDDEAQEDDEILDDAPAVFAIPEQRRSWFFRVLARTAAASALLFAGDAATARTYATRRQRTPTWQHTPSTDQTLDDYLNDPFTSTAHTSLTLHDDLTFDGTSYLLPMGGNQALRIFRGIERNAHNLLADGHIGRYLQHTATIQRRWQAFQSSTRSRPAATVGQDGTILAFHAIDT